MEHGAAVDKVLTAGTGSLILVGRVHEENIEKKKILTAVDAHMVKAWPGGKDGWKTPEGGAAHREAARDGMRRWTAVSTVLGLAVLLQVVEASPTALQRRSAARLADRRELTDNDRYTWMYAVGDNGMIMTSRPQEEGGGKPESGKQWLPLVSGSQEHLYDVMFISARSGLVVGAKSTMLQTSNLGNEWEAIDLGLPSPCNLYGVFIMAEGGPTYIVGEKGLFISSPDGETFTSTSLVCTVPGKECTQQTVSAGWNSNIVLHGARFRDADNGVLVGTNGTVILVQGGKEEGDRTFLLLKPVQLESSGILGPRFPDFLDVVSQRKILCASDEAVILTFGVLPCVRYASFCSRAMIWAIWWQAARTEWSSSWFPSHGSRMT